uniref:Immunoglobulin V-set domain-containing protein n=1 Tax=Lates calcarifer TaxID=8187 RepID=A0A4W6FT03_LATCA
MFVMLGNSFSVLCVSGVSQSVTITQWPHYISRLLVAWQKFHCYQNDTDYEYLYWYKQLRGKDIQLVVVLVVGTPNFEEGFKSGFQAVKVNEKQWSLTISSVQGKDEAFYLCAASSHQCCGTPQVCDKNIQQRGCYSSHT